MMIPKTANSLNLYLQYKKQKSVMSSNIDLFKFHRTRELATAFMLKFLIVEN